MILVLLLKQAFYSFTSWIKLSPFSMDAILRSQITPFLARDLTIVMHFMLVSARLLWQPSTLYKMLLRDCKKPLPDVSKLLLYFIHFIGFFFFRSDFKLLISVFKAIHGFAPPYLAEILTLCKHLFRMAFNTQ